MRQVWKFPIVPFATDIRMPKGAKLLHVALQNDSPCLWAEVDSTAPIVKRYVKTYGTGHKIDSGACFHVGTFQIGELVFHVYDGGEDV